MIGGWAHKVQQLMSDESIPNLGTKAGRKAFRHEMRMVAVRPRRWGLWLLTAGGACGLPMITKRGGLDAAEYARFATAERDKDK